MNNNLRILHLEDNPVDAELVRETLTAKGIECEIVCVETREEFIKGLEEFIPDLILADQKLPDFDGLSALEIVKERRPDVPFIFVTGTMGEEWTVETLKKGATDYIIKDRMYKLASAVQRALKEAEDKIELKRAEVALRESEEKFRNLFENANDGIFFLDLNGNFIDVNRTAYERLGYTNDEMLSMSAKELDTPEFAQRVQERIAQIQEHGHAMFESAHHRKDGSIMPVEVNSMIMHYKGQKVCLSVVRDITERKKAEEKLSHLLEEISKAKMEWELTFDSVTEIVALVDKELNIVRCNKSSADFCGMPVNAIPGHKFHDLFPWTPKDLEYLRDKIQNEASTEETEMRTETGRWFYVSSRPIIHKNGVFLYSVIIATDITGLKDAQEKIKESEEILKERVKELEKFYEMAVGRELKMKELKKEIQRLNAELSRYKK